MMGARAESQVSQGVDEGRHMVGGEYPPSSPEDHHDQVTTRLLPDEQHHNEDEGGENVAVGEDQYVESNFSPEQEDKQEGLANCLGRITAFVLLLVGCAALSGLLFGYDTGVISGTLVVIDNDLGHALSDVEKEVITSATTFGALLGGLASGAWSDKAGRKALIGIAGAVFIAGALLQAVCHTVTIMVLGRLVVGLAVGSASCIVPLYIGELSPSAIRGRLVTINCVAITLGQVLAYAVGAILQHAPNGWRWMVGFGAIPAALQLSTLHLLPESPRILVLRGDALAASGILRRIYPLAMPSQLATKVKHITHSADLDHEVSSRGTLGSRMERLFGVGSNRRALAVGAGLQATQQLCGFNTLMYYSASIFAALGFHNATAVGLVIASVNFLFTLVALKIVDPFGRRRTMLYTIPVMTVALLLASVFFHRLTSSTGGVLSPNPPSPYSATDTFLVLSSMLLYVAAYATGCGNIPWQQGELFRLEVRGTATGICTTVNWTCNLLVAATFLSLMRLASPAGAFGLYACACALSWTFCYYCYPETSGLSLEEVCDLFESDYGVPKSATKSRRVRASSAAFDAG